MRKDIDFILLMLSILTLAFLITLQIVINFFTNLSI